MHFNKIMQLPDALCALPKLRTLRLSFNKLYAIPEDIGQLKKLREIFLTG